MQSTSYSQIVGQAFRSRRALLGISLAKMAKTMGMSLSGWSRVETGVTSINIVHLRKAATQLHMKPCDIVRFADATANELRSIGLTVVDR